MKDYEIIHSYTFNPSAGTITFVGLVSVNIEDIQLIRNITTGQLLYASGIAGYGGSVSGNVLTLDEPAFALTAMSSSSTDDLQIFRTVEVATTGGGGGVLTETALSDGWSIEGGTTSRKLTVDGGDIEIQGGAANVVSFPFSGTAIFGKTIEVEIDFGSHVVSDKKFTITDALASTSSLITVRPSGNPATGRGSDDWRWDSIEFAAKGNSGNFTVYAKASGKIKGKRKILYTIN